MVKSNHGAPGSRRLAGRHAAELKGLRRDKVPADLRPLLAGPGSAEYYEGLLVGFAHAPRVARLIEYVAANAGRTRWEPIELRYRDRRVVIGRETRRLPPADLAFYAVLLRRRLEARGFVTWDTEGLAREYLREYRRLAPCLDGNRERVEARLARHGVERAWFEERKSKVNRAIRPVGAWTGCDYGIVSRGRRPNTRSGVIVEPHRIRIRDGSDADSDSEPAGPRAEWTGAAVRTATTPGEARSST